MFSETHSLLSREKVLGGYRNREIEVQNFAASRTVQSHAQLSARAAFPDHRIVSAFSSSVADRMMREQISRMNDPMYQMMVRAAKDAVVRLKERGLWYYRRTTGIISQATIRKAVQRIVERLFPKKFDPESFTRRISALLITQENCDAIVKVHSPPIRLFPKSLHPIDSVA
jgi:hypothetical protein